MSDNLVAKAIDTSSDFKTVKGIEKREKEVLTEIETKIGFVSDKNIWKSSYWGSETIGAANYLGNFRGKPAVLKIQGAKPALSEIDALDAFEKQNRSEAVRTAKLLDCVRWSDESQYEALVLEYVDGPKVIQSKKPTTKEEIAEFIDVYREYRLKCRNEPWLTRPTDAPDLQKLFEKATKIREEIYPNHPLRRESDDLLILEALNVLKNELKIDELEFVHGHLSAEDIFRVKSGKEYVLFSNLFWNWKHPYYDLVFAYHWLIYNLAEFPGTDRNLIESQRELWIGEMENVVESTNMRQFKTALLERACAGLMIDAFAYIDPKNPVALPLIESTRDQVKKLTKELP